GGWLRACAHRLRPAPPAPRAGPARASRRFPPPSAAQPRPPLPRDRRPRGGSAPTPPGRWREPRRARCGQPLACSNPLPLAEEQGQPEGEEKLVLQGGLGSGPPLQLQRIDEVPQLEPQRRRPV